VAITFVGCESSEPVLIVELKTDFVAGVEFDEVRLEVVEAGGEARLFDVAASRGMAWAGGVRLAEVEGLAAGTLSLTVELRRGPLTVAERPVSVTFMESTAVTVPIARTCITVTCPDTAGDPNLTACHGGRCVDPRCREETSELCGTPECTSASDCPTPGGACATARCEGGVCLDEGPATACEAAEYCDPDLGCLAVSSDAGVDSGMDAGDTAVVDTGVDTGIVSTAETCNGMDDDLDMRIDEAATGELPTVCAAFGATTLGTGRQNMSDQNLRVSRYTVDVRTEIAALHAFLAPTGGSSLPVRGIVYTPTMCGVGMACGDVAAFSEEVIVDPADGAKWFRFRFTPPITLDPGDYHLGIQNGSPGDIYSYAYSTSTGERFNWGSPYVATPPASFTAGRTAGDITIVAERTP